MDYFVIVRQSKYNLFVIIVVFVVVVLFVVWATLIFLMKTVYG